MVMDRMGNVLCVTAYRFVRNFSEGVAAVEKPNGAWTYIDCMGREVIEKEFENAHSFSEGKAIVEKEGSEYFVDRQGQQMFAKAFESARDFSEGLAAVNEGTGWYYINTHGESGVPGVKGMYTKLERFLEGRAIVDDGISTVIIDTAGEVCSEKYAKITRKDPGVFHVLDGLTEYYIDRNGKKLFAE